MAMIASAPTRRMTLDEWANSELEEDQSFEWVDGQLVEKEMTGAIHEIVVKWLLALLAGYFDPRGGFAFPSGLGFVVSSRRGRIPDISCFRSGRRLRLRGAQREPPDVVVEVVSPTTEGEHRDRVEKMEEYAAFGIAHYWLVDPDRRTFEVWELGASGRYALACAATSGRIVRVPGCDGLAVDLDALWREVDRLMQASD